jgi:hypothetical protein
MTVQISWTKQMLLANSSVLGYAPVVAERRAHERRSVDQAAELVIPSEQMALPCRVINISEGGAGIECDAIPQAGTNVILVMKNGKRFEGVTAWYGNGELGLRFVTDGV